MFIQEMRLSAEFSVSCTLVIFIPLQEIRWKEQGQIIKKDYLLFVIRPKTRTGQLSTGFVINKQTKNI
jgi:hypothetical protein